MRRAERGQTHASHNIDTSNNISKQGKRCLVYAFLEVNTVRVSGKRKSVEILNRYLYNCDTNPYLQQSENTDAGSKAIREKRSVKPERESEEIAENTQGSEIQQELLSSATNNLIITKKNYSSRNVLDRKNSPEINNIKLNNYIKKAQKIIKSKSVLR